MPFILAHLFPSIRERRKREVKRQPSAVSLKSCTSCTDLDFTLQATAISRKINYDVTQSRPEGAARLHTPKTCSTLSSLTTQNKTGATEQERTGREEGGEARRGMGVFSVSVTSMTQIFHQLQNLLTEVEVPQETHLFEIQRQTCTCAHWYLCTYPQKACMQNSRHRVEHTRQINTAIQLRRIRNHSRNWNHRRRIWQQCYYSPKVKIQLRSAFGSDRG